jgi:Tol biopolymer transport system component
VLNLATEAVGLIYSSERKLSGLGLNHSGDTFVFSQTIDGVDDEDEEICTLGINGTAFHRVTENSFWDLYPSWSPDGLRIAFLTWRDSTLDIYVIDANGDNERRLYDSGFHDADIHWGGDKIVFTRNSQIWIMNDGGTEAQQVTNSPNAGNPSNTNLPFGDYDPRLSPDGPKIVFERLVADTSLHGNYDFFLINPDGTNEIRITNRGYAQGFAEWSHSGDRFVYIVAAISDQGKYDIYTMNTDGGESRNITPDYFPAEFLCHSAVFSEDDSKIYFIGEWWD